MTEPLTPVGCDLTDFAFMPLDVARLRDSELTSNETPEACWAAVLLWATSWHQIPAASIPNDDKWIAKHAGYAQRGKIDRGWAQVRPGALRGWIECTDGRLYHPVVAEKAIQAWKAKLEQGWRTECSRIKKHNERHGTSLEKPTFEEWISQGCPKGQTLSVPSDKPTSHANVTSEQPSNRQGEGQGQGQGQGESKTTSLDSAAAPEPKPARATRLAKDWRLPKQWGEWALDARKADGWTAEDVRRAAALFSDHWIAKAGKDAAKLDWQATWRKWINNPLSDLKKPGVTHAKAERRAEAYAAFTGGDVGSDDAQPPSNIIDLRSAGVG